MSVFKMPVPVKIKGRSSSITNSFVNGIIPCVPPTEGEVLKVLEILDMKDNLRCAYCGGQYTEWDHFYPIVRDKKPTGYISEINNLVPACGKCNQSKGNTYWLDWIVSNAKLSPKTRKIDNLAVNILLLKKYEKWSNPTVIDFSEIIDPILWEEHWKNCEKLHELMHNSQKTSDQIKIAISQYLSNGKESSSLDTKQLKQEASYCSDNNVYNDR